MRVRALMALLLLVGCATPPPDAYVSSGSGLGGRSAIDLGPNAVGESCVQSTGAPDIYCGTWQQPSARLRNIGAADPATLATLVASGPWRAGLDGQYLCPPPQPVSLDGLPGLRMDCTGRVGGWPHVALALVTNGRAWVADGVAPAVPAMQQALLITAGQVSARTIDSTAVAAQQAERQGLRARASGDEREFDQLMYQGYRANLADNSSAAEAAYGAALAVHEKAQGRDSPNLADPLIHLALQVSNQGRYAEADALFERAAKLVPRQQGDTTLAPRLMHYRALHLYNEKDTVAALALMRAAEAAYAQTLPPGQLRVRPTRARGTFAASIDDVLASQLDRQTERALLGMVEMRRYEGVALRDLGRPAESQAAVRSAVELAEQSGLDQASLTARLRRTEAVDLARAGNTGAALAAFDASNADFARAYPASRPLALVGLLRAAELVKAGRADEAVRVCRASVRVLTEIKSGFEPERLAACLDAFAAAAGSEQGAGRQAILQEMFLAAQLVRSSRTEQQINQSAARLGAGQRDSKVGAAIRAQQDATTTLAAIRRQIELEAQTGTAESARAKRLGIEEQAAIQTLAQREADLQAAAPNYGQLVQQATGAPDILRLLHPGEAFAAITLTAGSGWTFLLQDGTVDVTRVEGGAAAVDPLVRRIRAAMTPQTPAFDTAASGTLYRLLFAGLPMDGVRALTVAPTGSLLSLPFGLLLTDAPGVVSDPARLATAPFLTRRMAIGHLPSAGNFVALRRLAGSSQAPRPWFGFGDFRNLSLAQARRSFGPGCGDSAALLAGLSPLPSAKKELALAGKLLGAAPTDELLGPAFTVAGVEHAAIGQYRVLHFATHAILPTELRCQSEPAIITSPPPGATDASGALLTASALADIKLDADLVILSACNSGGPDGSLGGGESLSSLARSFFYGGARALLITHWDVNDQAATFVILDTLRGMGGTAHLGAAAALQATQTGLLDRAGTALPIEFAHPYYWAPFALIGTAGSPGMLTAGLTSVDQPPAARLTLRTQRTETQP